MIVFSDPIYFGNLIKRYKRFFMDVKLENNQVITAHVPNTGSMLGLLDENNLVMLTKSDNINRKTNYTVQAILVGESWVGINTQLPNKLISSYLKNNLNIKSEVKYGPGLRSRVDLVLDSFYLEIKNVTLRVGDSAQFPDSVSSRALKHIDDLLYTKSLGYDAGLLFVVQRLDCVEFRAARHIDQAYADGLLKAHQAGLAIKAVCAKIDPSGLLLTHEIPCIF